MSIGIKKEKKKKGVQNLVFRDSRRKNNEIVVQKEQVAVK